MGFLIVGDDAVEIDVLVERGLERGCEVVCWCAQARQWRLILEVEDERRGLEGERTTYLRESGRRRHCGRGARVRMSGRGGGGTWWCGEVVGEMVGRV